MTATDAYVDACHHVAELAAQHGEQHPGHRNTARQLTSRAYTAARILPPAMTTIGREATVYDGWPERGDTAGRSSGTPRPTERVALTRTATLIYDADHIADLLAGTVRHTRRARNEPDPDNAFDHLIVANDLARQLVATCARWLPTPDKPARCAGTGDEIGARCGQLVDYRLGDNGTVHPNADGRCADCDLAVKRRQAVEAEQAAARRITDRETRRRLRRHGR